MSDGIYSALSGAVAQQRMLDVMGNNVANAGTSGYRGDRVAFAEALGRAKPPANRPNPLAFTMVRDVRTDFSQGTVQHTQQPLDLAIQGDGYFRIDTPHGQMFTRAGSFRMDSDQTIRDNSGNALLDENGNIIQIPIATKEITITPDGTFNADGNPVGKIEVVTFDNPASLLKTGGAMFRAGPGAGMRSAENSEVIQGAIESSNMSAITGMNQLITITRSFDAFQRVIHGFRDLDQRTARDIAGKA